jgi:hypothetical protein
MGMKREVFGKYFSKISDILLCQHSGTNRKIINMKSLPTYAIRLAVLCILALATIQSFAQTDSIIQEDWVSTYSRQDSIQNIATAVHGSCIYVAGHTSAAPNGEDITIIRYSDLGDTLWVRHFNGAGNGNDRALAVTCDASGNVFVTGYVTAAGGDLDMILLKYSINGNLLWHVSYDNGGTDIALAIGADASNNIYIGGNSFGVNNDDYTIIKYDNNGVQQWVEKYDNGVVDQLVASGDTFFEIVQLELSHCTMIQFVSQYF